jgi:hypothetical protein
MEICQDAVRHAGLDGWCSSKNGILQPGEVFSLFSILDIVPLRLRLQKTRNLTLNRNLAFLDEHTARVSKKGFSDFLTEKEREEIP